MPESQTQVRSLFQGRNVPARLRAASMGSGCVTMGRASSSTWTPTSTAILSSRFLPRPMCSSAASPSLTPRSNSPSTPPTKLNRSPPFAAVQACLHRPPCVAVTSAADLISAAGKPMQPDAVHHAPLPPARPLPGITPDQRADREGR